ncbi:hypothetical protein AMELA_G00289690 [Ameiurus melas]|uniref:Uncharacterized protein n=1 Tax=Ameiurus melas TaxID=219545 RepID=A0A7J5ZL12_AMEME|nr:hypothetical protein AMELA_G00289690 [Ameiurus melas]
MGHSVLGQQSGRKVLERSVVTVGWAEWCRPVAECGGSVGSGGEGSCRVFPDKDSLIAGDLEIAGGTAGRSPVAVQGTKFNLLYSRDHSVTEGLGTFKCTSASAPLVTSPRARGAESGVSVSSGPFGPRIK